MKKWFRSFNVLVVGFASALVLAAVAYAEEKEPEEKTKSEVIEMSREQVDRFIKALPVFIEEFPEYNPSLQASIGGKPDISSFNVEENVRKLNDFSAKFGYNDFNEFTRHFTGVLTGYTCLKAIEAKAMLDAQAKALPPETFAVIQAQMGPMLETIAEMKKAVSPELLEILKPRMRELDKIMGIGQK